MDDTNNDPASGLLGSLSNNPELMIGLLGLGNNPALQLMMAMQPQQTNPNPNAAGSPQSMPSPNNTQPLGGGVMATGGVITPLPSDKASLLAALKQSASQAYPDNQTLQKVALSQAILESGLLGKPSQLASKYNNLFGIKAPGTAGTVNMGTTEYYNGSPTRENSSFGANNTMADSFTQHRNLLAGSSRYKSVLAATDPYQAFTALKKSGYATDPSYAQKLSQIYNNYVAPMY